MSSLSDFSKLAVYSAHRYGKGLDLIELDLFGFVNSEIRVRSISFLQLASGKSIFRK